MWGEAAAGGGALAFLISGAYIFARLSGGADGHFHK
jgi:hypothetical protein